MRHIAILLVALSMSCATFDITRVGRNRRQIVAKPFITTKDQLVFHLIRKGVLMECRKLTITEIVERSHATAICEGEGHMFKTNNRGNYVDPSKER